MTTRTDANGKVTFTDPKKEASRRRGEKILDAFFQEVKKMTSPEAGFVSKEQAALNRLNIKIELMLKFSIEAAEHAKPGYKKDLADLYARRDNLVECFGLEL